MPRSRLIIIGIVGFVVLFFGLVFLGILPGKNTASGGKVGLVIWGVESQASFSALTQGLTSRYDITYKQFDPQTYESDVVNALAAGKGPDVFMIHSSWLPKHANKLIPAPTDQISVATFESLYPTVVEQDFAPDGAVYALPLYLDTLALFINRDLMDSAGIAIPPKTWADFNAMVTNSKLRKIDRGGKVIQAGGALGGDETTIHHATDILSLLMLQAGVPMVTKDFSRADFSGGAQVLKQYTDYANPAASNYTWSDGLGDAYDAFAAGKTASVFGYASDLPTIVQKNAFLKILVTPAPQPATRTLDVNVANYWGLAVSNRSSKQTGAWAFILEALANPTNVQAYVTGAQHLPALRSLLQGLTIDSTWGVFANESLSARSWPQIDPTAVVSAFGKMVDDVKSGKALPDEAISTAESTISDLMAHRP